MLLAVGLYAANRAAYQKWVSTEGRVTQVQETAHKWRGYRVYFAFTAADGTVQQGSDFFRGAAPDTLRKGETVRVWYNPGNPAQSLVSQKRPDGRLWLYVPLFLALPLGLYVATDGVRRHSRGLPR